MRAVGRAAVVLGLGVAACSSNGVAGTGETPPPTAGPESAGAPVPPAATEPVTMPPAATDPVAMPPAATEPVALPAARPVDAWGQPVPPVSPDELARRLLAVEAAVPAAGPDRVALALLGHEHQVLTRTLSRNAAWRPALTALLPAGTLARAEALVSAGTSSSMTVGAPLATVPAWRIRPPLDPATLRRAYTEAEAATGTPWTVLAAINLVETRMGRIVGPSSAGAQGPMQFLPGTWAVYGEGGDPYDDGDAIAAAARLLADRGAPGDLPAALHAYNPSDAYREAVLEYAAALAADTWLYDLLWGWQVYLTTVDGLQWLPEGFENRAEVPLADVAARLPPPVPPPAAPA